MDDPSHIVPRPNRVHTISAVALMVFALGLGVITSGPNILDADLSFARWIQKWNSGSAESLYRIGDMLGSTVLAIILVVIGLGFALYQRQKRTAIFLIIVVILRLMATQLKPLFDSPRPTSEHLRLLEHFDGTGYPSGHSTTVAMLATITIVLASWYVRNARTHASIIGIAFVALALVGWSRIWAGAHWPSDVLGGWSVGIALGILAWMLSDLVIRPNRVELPAKG